MRTCTASATLLVCALILVASGVQAFSTPHIWALKTCISPGTTVTQPPALSKVTTFVSLLTDRMDTIQAAGLSDRKNPPKRSIGFLGHSGLLLLSALLVKLVQSVAFPSNEAQQAGILSRCPWPFIVFHDPMQFLKDSPTWIIVTWVALWRILKYTSRAKVA